MADFDKVAAAALLKEMYPKNYVTDLVKKGNPLEAMIKKNTNVGEGGWKIPCNIAQVAGSGSIFVAARANKGPSKKVAFIMTAADDYTLASVQGKTWAGTMGNERAFASASKSELDAAWLAQRLRMGIQLYRDGTGSIGVVGSISTTTITLAHAAQAHCFYPGQTCCLASSATALPRGTLGTSVIVVSNVNRRTGVITFTADVAGAISGAAAGDHIFTNGDAYGDTRGSVGTGYKQMRGLQSWLPTSDPDSTTFFEVDRSVDVTQLGGNRVNATGMTIVEALETAATECAQNGGAPTCVFVHPQVFKRLGQELDTKAVYHDEKVGKFSFRGYLLQTDDRDIVVYKDRNVTAGFGFMLDLEYWEKYSIGEMPQILDLDNAGTWLRESDDNAYEMRVGGYPQLGSNFPGSSCVIYNLGEDVV